jgi:hypothetical protein
VNPDKAHFGRTLLVVGSGALAGAVGAVVAASLRESRDSHRPAAPALVAAAEPAVILPPGWDPALVSRVSNLERRLDAPSPAAAAPPSAAVGGAPATSDRADTRATERTEHYRKELAYRDKILADHANERADRAWARPKEENIQGALASRLAPAHGHVRDVDCRTATCAAVLSFDAPGDALAFIQGANASLGVAGCQGYTAIPPPPTHAGSYELTVVYGCREEQVEQ